MLTALFHDGSFRYLHLQLFSQSFVSLLVEFRLWCVILLEFLL